MVTMEIIQRFITNNDNYRSNRQITPKGIMLHSVGVPQPNPEIFANIFNTPRPNGRQVGVHAFLGADGRVFQTLPWSHRAWHCGGSGNDTHIGIEMTEPGTIRYTGGASWTDNNPERTRDFVFATYGTAVELFAFLCSKFDLNPFADGVILSHSEGHRRGIASNHADVEHIWNRFNLSMNQFRKDVQTAMNQQNQTIEKPNTPAPWAQNAWNWAINNGLTDGTRPTDPVTRQEIMVLFQRFYNLK